MSPVDSVLLTDQDSDEIPPAQVMRIHGHPPSDNDPTTAVSIEICALEEGTDRAVLSTIAYFHLDLDDLRVALELVTGATL